MNCQSINYIQRLLLFTIKLQNYHNTVLADNSWPRLVTSWCKVSWGSIIGWNFKFTQNRLCCTSNKPHQKQRKHLIWLKSTHSTHLLTYSFLILWTLKVNRCY